MSSKKAFDHWKQRLQTTEFRTAQQVENLDIDWLRSACLFEHARESSELCKTVETLVETARKSLPSEKSSYAETAKYLHSFAIESSKTGYEWIPHLLHWPGTTEGRKEILGLFREIDSRLPDYDWRVLLHPSFPCSWNKADKSLFPVEPRIDWPQPEIPTSRGSRIPSFVHGLRCTLNDSGVETDDAVVDPGDLGNLMDFSEIPGRMTLIPLEHLCSRKKVGKLIANLLKRGKDKTYPSFSSSVFPGDRHVRPTKDGEEGFSELKVEGSNELVGFFLPDAIWERLDSMEQIVDSLDIAIATIRQRLEVNNQTDPNRGDLRTYAKQDCLQALKDLDAHRLLRAFDEWIEQEAKSLAGRQTLRNEILSHLWDDHSKTLELVRAGTKPDNNYRVRSNWTPLFSRIELMTEAARRAKQRIVWIVR